MKIDRERVKRAFAEYVRDYDAEDPKVKLKIVHTYRVSELCETIADSIREQENLSAEDIDIAWLLGMLHDIGRFEQLRRYHTFFDAKSVSHAALACEILFEEGLLEKFISAEDDSERELIRHAIGCHSDYRIPEEYDERTKAFCRILRDADKVDIFRVNCETPLEDIYNVSTEDLTHAEVSGEVMENFRLCQATPRAIRKTPADYLVGLISMAFELVYPKSREIAFSQGYLDQLLHFSSENEKTRGQFEVLREIMRKHKESFR